MLSRNVKLLCLLLTLPSILGGHDKHRSQFDLNLRGHSFGLENFLFQSYENEGQYVTSTVKPKGVRATTEQYRIPNERIQAYGLDNLNPHLYESSKLKPTPVKPIREFQKRRPIESGVQRGTVGVKREEPTTPKTYEADTIQQETATREVVTERIRKRVMMRRRKRPTNVVPTEENNEGNTIVKPVRIPVFPQVSKVVIRTKVPSADDPRIRPVGVKSIKTTTPPPEVVYADTIAQSEDITKSTASTTQETTTTDKPSTINLKTFLKQQTETLSLSELLQTQNLSLADLLRGSKDASAILKARQSTTSTTTTQSVSVKKKTFNRIESTTEIAEQELPKKIEIVEVTTSRPNYNRFYPKIPRIKPGDPKPEDKPAKDVENNAEESKTRKTFLSAAPSSLDPQTRLSELRSKLRNFQKKGSLAVTKTEAPSEAPAAEEIMETVSVAPQETVTKSVESSYKRNRISFKSSNNPELSVILPTKVKPEVTEKRPDRITNWTNRLPPNRRFGQEKKQIDNLIKPLKVPVSTDDSESSEENASDEIKTTTKPPEEVKVEEVRKPEAKDELIELLKYGHNADRLQKILYSRNMTLQELLENREKPPLQMNISELFSKEVKIKSTTTPSTFIFDSLPDFDLEEVNKAPEPAGYDEPYAEESVPSVVKVEFPVNREPKQFDVPVSKNDGDSQLNLQPDDLSADTSNAENSALWKLSEKSIYYGSSFGFGDEATTKKIETEKPQGFDVTDELTENDIILLKTLRRNQETNRKFKIDLNEFMREEDAPVTEDIEKSYIPPAVKSAIIASGVVMGIALFVFIAIFATCGWKQRQIRLKGGASSILGDTLTKPGKSKRSNLSPVTFKDTSSYKKTIDFDEESESGSSNTSSYLWNTLKNTFKSRTSTLKSRLEKEEKMREDKMTLRRNESRRQMESRLDDRQSAFDEISTVKKIDRDRNVINTSFNFKRSQSNNNLHQFNDCAHEY